MAGNPQKVTQDTTFTWDGVSQRLARGTILDVTPGSALEAAIGAGRLIPLRPVTAPAPGPAVVPAPAAPPSPPAKAAPAAPAVPVKRAPARPATGTGGDSG